MDHIRRPDAIALTHARLLELLRYDPETGIFTWLIATGRSRVGARAGSMHKPSGYWLIKIDRVRYRAGRLAWLCMTGEWPAVEVDHRDLDNSNDRWTNLREATQSQNKANSRTYRNNRAGIKGVRRRWSGWEARISKDGKAIFLGTFPTAEQAAEAYAAASRNLYGDFGRSA